MMCAILKLGCNFKRSSMPYKSPCFSSPKTILFLHGEFLLYLIHYKGLPIFSYFFTVFGLKMLCVFRNQATVSLGLYFTIMCCQAGGGKTAHNMNQLFVTNVLYVLSAIVLNHKPKIEILRSRYMTELYGNIAM